MLNADVTFYNGLLLEGKMTDAFVRVATSGKPVFAVNELIEESYLIAPQGAQGHYDPHVWMDPQAWANTAEAGRDTLAARRPAGRERTSGGCEQRVAYGGDVVVYSREKIKI